MEFLIKTLERTLLSHVANELEREISAHIRNQITRSVWYTILLIETQTWGNTIEFLRLFKPRQ